MRLTVLSAALAVALGSLLSGAAAIAAEKDRVYPMTMFDAAAALRSDSPVHGKTIRWTWTDGPLKGVTQEHVFHGDGTLDWRVIQGPGKGRTSREKRYAAAPVSEDVYTVSYPAGSGYTMTVILNFKDGAMVGITSGAADWYSARGTFTIVQ